MFSFSWNRPEQWPLDIEGYVFFPRAFDVAGRKLFPTAWTGAEQLFFTRGYRSDAQAQVRFIRTRQEMRARLAVGRLVSVAVHSDGSRTDIAPGRWSQNGSNDWLANCAIPDKVALNILWAMGASYPLYIRLAELEGLTKIVDASHASNLHQQSLREPAKRGRKQKYDWEAFVEEVHKKLAYEGGISPGHDVDFNQAALEEHMATWCEAQWGVAPGESTVRERIGLILQGQKLGQQ